MLHRRGFLAATAVITTAPGCTGVLEDDQDEKEHILTLYESGLETGNRAGNEWDRGVSAFEDERYEAAENYLSDVEEDYADASDDFARAAEIAIEIGQNDARDICGDASEYASLMEEAARYLKRSATDAQDGEYDSEREKQYGQGSGGRSGANQRSERVNLGVDTGTGLRAKRESECGTGGNCGRP